MSCGVKLARPSAKRLPPCPPPTPDLTVKRRLLLYLREPLSRRPRQPAPARPPWRQAAKQTQRLGLAVQRATQPPVAGGVGHADHGGKGGGGGLQANTGGHAVIRMPDTLDHPHRSVEASATRTGASKPRPPAPERRSPGHQRRRSHAQTQPQRLQVRVFGKVRSEKSPWKPDFT